MDESTPKACSEEEGARAQDLKTVRAPVAETMGSCIRGNQVGFRNTLCAGCDLSDRLHFQASAYSVLSHEAIIDVAWKDNIRPLLLSRFPNASPDDLRNAPGRTPMAEPSYRTWATIPLVTSFLATCFITSVAEISSKTC